MQLSHSGAKMAGVSGLRSIMDDVAASTAGVSADDWLNLSVGNPAPIPAAREMWQAALAESLAEDFSRAGCHYGPSRGSQVLVEAIAGYFNRTYGWELGPENIVVGPGSQMVCFAAASLFAGPGPLGDRRVVLPMVPDYTGYQGLCMHDGGIVGIAPLIQREGSHRFRYALDLDALHRQSDIGMLLVSSPGNPTGRALERSDVDALTALAVERDVPLFIDHAYGSPFPQIAEVHTEPMLHRQVVHCFSASKRASPANGSASRSARRSTSMHWRRSCPTPSFTHRNSHRRRWPAPCGTDGWITSRARRLCRTTVRRSALPRNSCRN